MSLSKNGIEIGFKELNEGYSHAENLHVFIDQLLSVHNLMPSQLSAVALSAGPGSYTGLRIGTSAAKGLCYALNIPLIAISTLELMTVAAMKVSGDADYYLPMLDARRMEVYCGIYNRQGKIIMPPQAFIVDENNLHTLIPQGKTCVFGDGMPKCRELFKSHENCIMLNGVNPSARHMHETAFEKFSKNDFENVAYFEPYYLKEYMFAQKQK